MWNLDWLLWGGISFLLAVINIFVSLKSKGKWPYVVIFCSLSLGSITIFKELKTIESWVEYGEVVALESLPKICDVVSVALPLLVIINLVALVIMLKKNS